MLLVVPSALLGLKDNQSDQKKQKCGSKKQAMNGVESLSKKKTTLVKAINTLREITVNIKELDLGKAGDTWQFTVVLV